MTNTHNKGQAGKSWPCLTQLG